MSAPADDGSRNLTIASFLSAFVALLFLPPVFGITAVALGHLGYRRGDPLGRTATVVGVIALVAGTVIGIVALHDNS